MLIPACLALLAAGTACTVKEDRGPCPCYLQVSFTDPDAIGEAQLLGWDHDQLFRDHVRIEEARPAWTKPVRKGMLVLSACVGMDESYSEGHQMRIPSGSQADSLYAWFEEVDATGDLAYAKVSFRKQFATVFLDIRKPADVVRSCRFDVEGNSCGFDLLDFSPPRQSDQGLSVTILPKEGPSARFPLGEYIERLGYNWKTEELQDIYVAIDLVRGLVDVRVEDWEEGTVFPLVEP